MRILVAGGAGFVPSHLADTLQSQGHEVVIVDNFVTGQRINLEKFLKNGGQLVEHDINQTLPNLGRFDRIYNMASPASPVDFAKMPLFILNTALQGHQNLLRLATENRARILFASSSEVYGDAEVHPQVETYFGNVNTFGPRSCYDEAKRVGETLSLAFNKEFNTEIRIARIFNTYGTRMRPSDGRIIPNFFTQALKKQALTVHGDGKQTRSFCYVSDLVAGLIALMESSESTPVNLGNPTEKTVLEMAETINLLTGNSAGVRFVPMMENDPKQRRPNIDKAKQKLHWEPRVSLAEGLEKSKQYFISMAET